MIEEKARIVNVEPGYAWVETQRQSSCGQCAAKAGCGTAVISKVVGNRMARVRALNPHSLPAGADVVVGIAENSFVRGAFLVYMVPLLTLFAGASLPLLFGSSSDAASILSGLGGLAIGLYWLQGFSKRIADDADYQAVILRACAQPLNFTSLP